MSAKGRSREVKESKFTYEDVAEVCEKFKEAGLKATVKSVRTELGGGSNIRVLSFSRNGKMGKEGKRKVVN